MTKFLMGVVCVAMCGDTCQASGNHGGEPVVTMNRGLQEMATVLFAIAVLHTFLVGKFRAMAKKYPEGSKMENLLHLLGEVEVVFLAWAAALFVGIASFGRWHDAIDYIESRDFTEPKFVFVIMAIAATRPVIEVVDTAIRWCGLLLQRVTPLSESGAFLFSALVVGPLLGSLVTEPAAMTVTAWVLKKQFYDRGGMSKALMYGIMGTLFVNVSIGGTLTNFAAPPVLMVAKTWSWSTEHMLLHFGWKAALAASISALGIVIVFRRELAYRTLISDQQNADEGRMAIPVWVKAVHLAALAFVVATGHHSDVFFGGFVMFLGFTAVTSEYQDPLKLREALLVGGFLAGLITMGGLQEWWLRPLLASLGEFPLYVGCTALTAVTDNAALTYLGSQVSSLSEEMKYALVAGAVTGGGLTVIANAPNPAGYSVLNASFQERFSSGISPLWLLLGATPATGIAFMCLWFLPKVF